MRDERMRFIEYKDGTRFYLRDEDDPAWQKRRAEDERWHRENPWLLSPRIMGG